MYKDNIRISVVSTFRITDCDAKLIAVIDDECRIRGLKSRVELIRQLSGNPLENKDDVKALRKQVKSQGFKTIANWLEYKLIGGGRNE